MTRPPTHPARLMRGRDALTPEQRRTVKEIAALTRVAPPRAIPVGALVEPDGHPLSTVSAVPTVSTPANDDGGQP